MSGAIANTGAALGEGLNSGADFGSKIVSANREREQHGLEQKSRQAAAGALPVGVDPINELPSAQNAINDANPQANAQAHTGFLQSLGQGLQHIGSGIAGYFGGPSPGAAPAGALPAPGGAPQAIPTPGAMPAPAQPVAPTANVQGGVAMLAEGGPMPNTGAALGAGLNAGADFGSKVVGANREREQHGLDVGARQATADAIPDPSQDQASQSHPVEQFAEHLHQAALNDSGVPNGKAGIAAPAGPQAQLAQAAQNPAAQQGIPEQPKGGTPNQAHSLSPQFWDDSDSKLLHAAKAAALAGHDPDTAYQALNHVRTSFVQGHMLRNLSAASVALQNGNMAGVEQGLRNMNYYLPDGKDLEVQKDAQGNLVYQNPIEPYLDANGAPTATKSDKPNLIPVDQQHLQMLGTAMLDPMKVNDVIVGARSAAAKQALEAAQTQAQITNSQARMKLADVKAYLAKSTSIRNLSEAQLAQARAAAGGFALKRWQVQVQNEKLDPSTLRGAQAAGSAIDDALVGKKAAVPVEDKDGNPSLSPAAGKVVHDPKTVPKELQDVDALEAGEMHATAGDLYIANMKRGMSPSQAAQLTLKLRSQKGKSHPGADGKPQPNAYIHRDMGEMGIWNPSTKMYDKYAISAQTAAGQLDGGGRMSEDDYIKGAFGGAGAPTNSGETSTNPDDYIMAQEPGEK